MMKKYKCKHCDHESYTIPEHFKHSARNHPELTPKGSEWVNDLMLHGEERGDIEWEEPQ